MGEWISLAELAGWPIVGQMIQLIRKKVRDSLSKAIEISLGDCSIPVGKYWCPIVIGINVVSKTPAKLRIIGIRYVVYQDGNPIQSGNWEFNLPVSSSGYPTSIVIIESKKNGKFEIGVNPLMLGRWPASNSGWKVEGVLDISCGYGVLNKPFETTSSTIENEQKWTERGSEFKQRFQE